MPLDPTVSLGVKVPEPVNPLTTAGQVAGTINAMNQNRLFGQEFAARKAMGPIYQSAIGPDGKLDTNRLLQGLAASPDAAFKLPEAVQSALEREKAQADISGKLQEQHIQRLNYVNNTLGSLLTMPGGATRKDVIGAIADAVAQGHFNKDEATGFLSSLPADDAQLQPWLLQHYATTDRAAQMLPLITGSPTVVNTGGRTNVIASSALPGGGTRLLGAIDNTMAPGEAATPVPIYDAGSKTPRVITKAEFARGAGGAPAAAAPGPSGVPSPAAVQPNAAAAPRAPGFQAGPGLGEQEGARVAAEASANQGVSLQKLADEVPTRKAALGNMAATLDKFTPGPTSDLTKDIKSLAVRYGIAGPETAKGVAAQEEFTKLATQIALQQIQALGGVGTDDKLGAAIQANPSTALSALGNKQIIGLLQGNEDALAAKNREWQAWLASGHGPESYGQFSTEFNKTYDPRVFQSVYMSPEQKQDILKGLSGAEKDAFRRSYNLAVEKGWISDPRKANAQ